MTETSVYLAGNFAPVAEEVTATNLPVRGRLPEELSGRYLRIGPNPLVPPDPAAYHWFLGDGMVHGIRLRAGKAEWYRNRWVRNQAIAEARGEPDPPGEVHGGMDFSANTNVIGHGGRTLALVEAGARPIELSWDLETVRRSDFQGTLPNGFTAHPKLDPVTGELHACAYYWGLPHLQYLVVGTDGLVVSNEAIPVPGSPMVHDMSITGTRAVFYDQPVTFDLSSAPFPYSWNPDYGNRIGVLPFGAPGSEVVWVEMEPSYVFHPLNAYDEGETVVVDVVRHDRIFDRGAAGPYGSNPALWRWTIDPAAGKVHTEQLDDRPSEFPRVDERVVGRRHRYGWSVGLAAGDSSLYGADTLLKHDLVAGTSQARTFPAGVGIGEAVFVPRSPISAEDDGWVLLLAYDAARDTSDLFVLDAADVTAEPVATVELPQRVPEGFHGNWVADAP